MADNFQAEAVSSGDQIFATDQRASDSAHFAIGKLAHGALDTFTLTTASDPFPVKNFGNDSSAPVHITTDSGSPPTFNIGNQSTVFTQTGYSTVVTVTDLSTASKIQTEPVTSSANRTFVDNNSAHPVFVRGLGDSTVPVSGSVTVSNIDGNDTTVTVTNGLLKEAPSSAGGLTAQTVLLSSLAQTFMTAVGRLFHISVSNESSAADVWFRVFGEDSAGVTLGTAVPLINQLIPQQGGREMDFGPYGVAMSSGMSIAASDSAASSAHTAPAATAHLTAYFAPST